MNDLSHAAPSSGSLWFALAAGATIAVSMSFGSGASSPQQHGARLQPQQGVTAIAETRLDEGVDWSLVVAAGNVVPLAIASYDR